MTAKNQNFSQEKLLIKDFASALALKDKIRDTIAQRKLEHWHLCCMKSVGSYLSLIFVNQL